MFPRLSWSCLGRDHLHFYVLNSPHPQLIREAVEKVSALGLVDPGIGLLILWSSLWLTSQTQFYSL